MSERAWCCLRPYWNYEDLQLKDTVDLHNGTDPREWQRDPELCDVLLEKFVCKSVDGVCITLRLFLHWIWGLIKHSFINI